jgi:hypothetical protein
VPNNGSSPQRTTIVDGAAIVHHGVDLFAEPAGLPDPHQENPVEQILAAQSQREADPPPESLSIHPSSATIASGEPGSNSSARVSAHND